MIRFDQRKRTLARRELRLWLANALLAVCVTNTALSWAEEGVRELKNPQEMAQVAPMRAVGIRLMPAAPMLTSEAARPVAIPVATRVAPGPATASLKVSVNTSNLPKVAESVSNATPRKPERIVPKPMLVEAATAIPRQVLATIPGSTQQGGASDAMLVVPQAPIRLSFSNEEIQTEESVATSAVKLPPSPHTFGLESGGLASAAVSPAANTEVEGNRNEANVSPIPTASPEGTSLLLPSRTPSRPVPASGTYLPSPVPDFDRLPPASSPAVDLEPTPEPKPFVEPAGTNPIEFNKAMATVPQPMPSVPTMQLETSRLAPASLPTAVKHYSDEELSRAIGVDLDSQGTREIQVDVAIAGLTVSDERICRAIASDGRVYLVGGELGETIVEVRSSSSSEPKLLRVKVIAPWQRAAHGVADLDQLRHALRPMCTDSQLSIRAQNDGSIVVQGVVDSKETAKRVLELTRKLTLVPVVDKLEIR